MALAWLMAVQAAASPAALPMLSIDFDLAAVKPAAEAPPLLCDPVEGEDIVVCGRILQARPFTPEEMDRLARLYAEKPVRAAIDLGGGAKGAFTFAPTQLPGGVVSNRVMVGIKLPF